MTSWSSVTRDVAGSALGSKQPSTGQLTTTSLDTPPAQSPSSHTPVNESKVSVISTGHESKRSDVPSAVVYDRNWESEMENVLKVSSFFSSDLDTKINLFQEIYAAVKNQQILQPLGTALGARASTSSLSPHGTVLRSRSLRGPPDRLTSFKRGSIRGLQSILTAQAGTSPYSSSSSIDGRASPAPSFATSHEVSL